MQKLSLHNKYTDLETWGRPDDYGKFGELFHFHLRALNKTRRKQGARALSAYMFARMCLAELERRERDAKRSRWAEQDAERLFGRGRKR